MFSRSEANTAANNHPTTAALTLLLVEDDLICREIALTSLRGLFAQIVVAVDGTEGLKLFQERPPDVVLSDQLMPGLSGLELFREIRALNQNIPLILMTGHMENETLLEAINLGVNRFIPKHFDLAILVRVLNDIIRELLDKRQLEQCRRQEMELLRYRDSYNSMQQEAARRKEQHVARHDLRNQLISGLNGIRWGINVVSSPRDIMCGDGYTIRNLSDGRQLIFVVDAMGAGLSAALSALLATSFCNYQVDQRRQDSQFSLQLLLKHFQEYLGGILLDEEALSCEFLLIDLMAQKLELAIFGMPPLLMRGLDGTIENIPGNNPPLSIYSGVAEISQHNLAEVADIMLMTDGITEASLPDGSTYREQLEDDFLASPTLMSLLRRFKFLTASADLDDLTLLHLQRLDIPAAWNWSGKQMLHLGNLAETINEFLQALTAEVELSQDERSELENLLHELITDALKNDCPRSYRRETARLLPGGGAKDFPAQQAAAAKLILSASLRLGSERSLLLVEINDNERPGPQPTPIKNSPALNSLRKIGAQCDSFYIGSPGGCRVILKTIGGGRGYAH
ncbi:MAG: response regulator [Desulfobulbaceae bacterium]|nr:response regulator [Desulfobulbaceae bacterium]